ncbi:MAG TPA: WecB/TagA/CpsF family glycosyltransferase [Candidatus Sumerlaeota bacterium]|nr:WecB/TagA/CpsF family glycosyltransferase [Candidatus Sumerlaeota bacterium]
MSHRDQHTAHILGLRVNALKTDDFISLVTETYAGHPAPLFITYLNAHCVNLYFQDPEYARIVDGADVVYADGQAVVWASRYLGEPLPERVNAGDFLPEFCRACAREGRSVYLLGSYPGVAEKAARAMEQKAPGLKVAGFRDGFFSTDEADTVAREVRDTNPDIVLVGMGVPLQEKFAWEHCQDFGAGAVWCVGALFEYYAGRTARAPVWMRRTGLEWLFRLIMEPCRMWRRYLIGNVRFIRRVIRSRKTK